MNLLARGMFKIVDVGFIDIKLQQQFARLVCSFQHYRNPFPLRQPIIESLGPEPIDPVRQAVAVVLGQLLAFVSGRQTGIEKRAGGAAADFARNAIENVKQVVENR